MKISLLFLIVLFCGSCAGYRVSRFTTDPVKIGSPKELVLKKYGPPFKINSYNNVMHKVNKKNIIDKII